MALNKLGSQISLFWGITWQGLLNHVCFMDFLKNECQSFSFWAFLHRMTNFWAWRQWFPHSAHPNYLGKWWCTCVLKNAPCWERFLILSLLKSNFLRLLSVFFSKWPNKGVPLIRFLGPRDRINQHVFLYQCTKFGTFIRKITISAYFSLKAPDYTWMIPLHLQCPLPLSHL